MLAFYAFVIFHLWLILDGNYVLEPALVIFLILNLKESIFLDSVENEAVVQGNPGMFNILWAQPCKACACLKNSPEYFLRPCSLEKGDFCAQWELINRKEFWMQGFEWRIVTASKPDQITAGTIDQ